LHTKSWVKLCKDAYFTLQKDKGRLEDDLGLSHEERFRKSLRAVPTEHRP